MESHYEALGLSPTADEQEVRRAYRALLKDYHPDQGGSRANFLRIKNAYEEIIGEQAPENHETDGGAVAHPNAIDHAQPTYDPTERTDGRPDHETLTVDGSDITLTLSALVQPIPLERLVEDHVPAATERTVAFFRVHNTSSTVVSWDGTANTSFIGDDGFLYEGSSIVRTHAGSFPGQWWGTDADIEPGRALDAVVVAQEVPDDVSIEKVLYTHHSAEGEIERYLFEFRPLVRERLNRLPFSE